MSHPILLLQHMIWHDGYHYGQIKLAGHPLTDEEMGPVSWDVWMNKREPPASPTGVPIHEP